VNDKLKGVPKSGLAQPKLPNNQKSKSKKLLPAILKYKQQIKNSLIGCLKI